MYSFWWAIAHPALFWFLNTIVNLVPKFVLGTSFLMAQQEELIRFVSDKAKSPKADSLRK